VADAGRHAGLLFADHRHHGQQRASLGRFLQKPVSAGAPSRYI